MRLAKPRLDIGLFTDDIEAQREFWGGRAGLRLDHELTLERGWVQHRFDAHGSVVKVNHLAEGVPFRPPSGITGLAVAVQGRTEPWTGSHPGGDRVALVPPGTDGVTGIGVTLASSDPDRLLGFYTDALEFEPVARDTVRCGESLLTVVEGASGSEADDVIGPGFRYLTVQVFDADTEMAAIVRRGGRIARAAISFAGVARFGFVADPDGNWIEISARTSLTGIEVGSER
ncbi:VOC family protein [Pseudonocardia spinosispora]|uniref:VOC family protein n=1 Tax=Pseudonocardia spinosispora TaxID=103441 RepID=UPI00042330DB|nr:VOC family protein [Pseudonocardia spinosispora]